MKSKLCTEFKMVKAQYIKELNQLVKDRKISFGEAVNEFTVPFFDCFGMDAEIQQKNTGPVEDQYLKVIISAPELHQKLTLIF